MALDNISVNRNPSKGPSSPCKVSPGGLVLAVLLVLLWATVAWGAEADKARQRLSVATLNDLVQKAPDVRLSRWQEQILAARRDHIISWPNPSAAVDLSWKQSENSGLAFGLELGQELPVWGRAAFQKKWLKARSRIAFWRKKKIQRNTMASAVLLSYRLFIAQRVSEYQKKRRGYYRLMLKYLRSRPFASPKKKINKMMVETQYSRLLHRQKKTTIQRDKMRSKLKEIFPSLAQKEWLFAFSMVKVSATGNGQKNGSGTGSGVQIPAKQLKKVLKGDVNYRILKAHKKSLRDKINWQKSLAHNNPALTGYYSQEPAAPQDRYYGMGLSFPLPFKQENRSEIAASKKEIQKIQKQMERRKQILSRRLKGLRQRLVRQREMIQLFPISRIQKLSASMKRAQREFRRGTIDLMDFWSLENQVSDAVQKIYNLQKDYVHTLVKMWMLTGDRRLLEEIAHAD